VGEVEDSQDQGITKVVLAVRVDYYWGMLL
jgi:hypothetical protein